MPTENTPGHVTGLTPSQESLLSRANRWRVVKWMALPTSLVVGVEQFRRGDVQNSLATIALGTGLSAYAYTSEVVVLQQFDEALEQQVDRSTNPDI